MYSKLLVYLVFCIGLAAAIDLENLLNEFKDLKEHVKKLETLTENLLNGHVKSKKFICY